MKILITGSTGFIGSHCAKKFISLGHNVLGTDIVPPNHNLHMSYRQVDLLTDDLTALVKEYLPDVIVHCAGSADVNFSVKNPDIDFERNFIATKRLLQAIDQSEYKCRFLFLSSAAVYGQPMSLPIPENAERNPLSPYALNKMLAEDMCFYYRRVKNMDIIVLRLFSAYGPGLRKQLFWDMFCRLEKERKLVLFGTGKEQRDYIYINDIVSIISLIATKQDLKYHVFNIASGKGTTIKEVGRLFSLAADYKGNIEFNNIALAGNPQKWEADISRLKEIYTPSTNLEDGIRSYYNWVKEEWSINNGTT